jgi:hypothetical protein
LWTRLWTSAPARDSASILRAVTTLRGSTRTRAIASAALVVVACVLAFVSVLAVWTGALLLNTKSYVKAVGPLIEKPALRDEIAIRVVDQLYSHVDVPGLLRDALPKRADVLAPTLAQGIHDTSVKLASAALATSAVRRVWEDANRIAHDQVVHVLEGKGKIVSTARGEVAIELQPLAEQVQAALDKNGVHIFDSVRPADLQRRFVLFRSVDLARAQRATRLLQTLRIWLPIETVVAFGAAVLLARDQRLAIGRSALALAATMVLMTAGIAVGRAFYLDHVGGGIPRATAAVPFDGLVRSLRFWVRVLFALAVGAWFATWVAGSREVLAREREVRAALSRAASAHRRVFAGGGVIVGALVLVAWDRPSPRAILGIVLLVGLWEAGVRFLAQGTLGRSELESGELEQHGAA